MKEPQRLMTAVAVSIQLMVLNVLLTVGIFSLFRPVSPSDFGFGQDGFSRTVSLEAVVGLSLLLIVHEMLHLVMIPGFASSDRTCAGITYAGGFVYTEEEIPKARYLLVTALPFVIISVLLPLVLGNAGLLTAGSMALILFNSMASSVDVLSMFLILTQASAGSRLTGNGTRTYWKQM